MANVKIGKPIKPKKDELGVTIQMVGSPQAVIAALVKGLPREALGEFARKLEAEIQRKERRKAKR